MPGRYHLFCAEYCGTRHSGMIGEVVVMEPTAYQTWLSGGTAEGSLASAGAKLFQDLACNTCHRPDAQGRGPVLEGLFGKTQTLQTGETIVVDEAYVRESILNPGAKITAGFQPIMPAFQGLVTEEQLLALIEYVKSLQAQPQEPVARPVGAGPAAGEATPAGQVDHGDPLLLPRRHYLNDGYGIRSWLLTRDHKRIALLYLAAVTVFFFVGGAFAVLIRLELATPAGDLVSDETYNKLFTMHGVMMVFFFLIPVIPAVLGNFLVPIMIGAKDLAFPKLNLASWYIYILGGLFTLYALVTGGVDTGWTFYTPFSTVSSTTNVIPTALGIFITGFSSILTGLNFIVTIHRMRAPGMTWFRMPLFLWSMYATSLIMVLGTPVIAITTLLRRRRAAVPFRHLRSVASAAIRCCSSTCSGSTRTRPSTSWCCRRWASSASWSPRSAGSRSSATRSSRSPASASRSSAFSSGAITCSSPASRSTPRWSSRF